MKFILYMKRNCGVVVLFLLLYGAFLSLCQSSVKAALPPTLFSGTNLPTPLLQKVPVQTVQKLHCRSAINLFHLCILLSFTLEGKQT